MSMNDDEIKAALAALLAKGHRRKKKAGGWFAVILLFAVVAVGGLAYDVFAKTLDFGVFFSVVLTVVAVAAVAGLIQRLEAALNRRRARRLVRAFRKSFTEESGDHARALVLLRASQTEEKVEKDLLEELDPGAFFDPFQTSPGAPKAAPAQADGLLGDFEPAAAGPPKAAPGADGTIPLDPYGSSDPEK